MECFLVLFIHSYIIIIIIIIIIIMLQGAVRQAKPWVSGVEEDEINVPIALGAFRDKSVGFPQRIIFIVQLSFAGQYKHTAALRCAGFLSASHMR